ncbi:hypothetical protein LIER_05805 [Lithospermum erythrorhizon]|uniref:Uncharacterized protein n=1 Tax=Lithospermum erythrorhizon TaxID=34254 RepID=A0AAV3P362_LITER
MNKSLELGVDWKTLGTNGNTSKELRSVTILRSRIYLPAIYNYGTYISTANSQVGLVHFVYHSSEMRSSRT